MQFTFRNIRAVFNYAIDQEYTTYILSENLKYKKEETREKEH